MDSVHNSLPGVPLVESPLFDLLIDGADLAPHEQALAKHLNTFGYAVLDFPDAQIEARIERIKAALGPRFPIDLKTPGAIKTGHDARIQDAWQFDEDVRAIATNAEILSLLSRLYGRQAFPFQTLNFPVGTQQPYHSDSIHFSSEPERFMCGVWLAMEDISEAAGPLVYYPGSHRWPILTNAMLGRLSDDGQDAQRPFEPAWRQLVEASGLQPVHFQARKGQALIWAANLLHGGSLQTDPTLTRWSQVTHYFFEDCSYLTPAFTDPLIDRWALRSIQDIATGQPRPNMVLGEALAARRSALNPPPPPTPPLARRILGRIKRLITA